MADLLKRKPLGQTGLNITSIGLGAQTVGGLGYGDQDQTTSQAVVEAYLSGGGRFIDVARGYGTSEIHVGKAIKASGIPEDEIVVCSKTGSLHPPVAASDLDVSRFCLQRDWIDVYYVHVPTSDQDAHNKILDAFCEFKAKGLIRHVGLSCRNFSRAGHCEEVQSWIHDPRVEVIQFPFNFASPEVGKLIAEAEANGVGAVCRGSVNRGLFNDKLLPGHQFTDTENDCKASIQQSAVDEILSIVQTIKERYIGEAYPSVAQLSQAWILQQQGVSACIGGAGSIKEVESLLAVNHCPLIPDEISNLLIKLAAPISMLEQQREK